MKKKSSISGQIGRLLKATVVLTLAVLIVSAATIFSFQARYRDLLHNITTISDFNKNFKEDMDLKMYYYVIESRYSEGLPLDEVHKAQDMAESLIGSTTDHDSLEAIKSVLELCNNLEERIIEIENTDSYDERQMQLENNIYVLTSLIKEYMYEYLYCEAVQVSNLQEELMRRLLIESLVIFIVTSSVFLVMTRYSIRLGRSVAGPVEQLNKRMEEIGSGDLTVHEPVTSAVNEIDSLSAGVEQMVGRMGALIRESTDKQESLRRAELALLQAQINPHFLYNTLDTIIWLVEAGENDKAVEMVSNLSDFFRHSLSNGEDIITLAEERWQITSYLQIQQARYKDILNYTIEIDEDILDRKVPKLTLQPLVENALYHGVKEKRGQGHIDIKGYLKGEDIILTVSDDGAGMSSERLEQLKKSMDRGERVGFGLTTVHERLRLFFGDEYGLRVESTEGKGTVITARIPSKMPEAVIKGNEVFKNDEND